MKIYFENLAKENIRNILRRCGYVEIFDRQGGKTSYVRRLGTYFYPRFHIYAEETENRLTINLHLDQKKASYHGQIAHSGEYDDDLVKQEAEKIKESINPKLETQNPKQIINSNDKRSKWFRKLVFRILNLPAP